MPSGTRLNSALERRICCVSDLPLGESWRRNRQVITEHGRTNAANNAPHAIDAVFPPHAQCATPDCLGSPQKHSTSPPARPDLRSIKHRVAAQTATESAVSLERVFRVSRASPEQQALIDRILDGQLPAASSATELPLFAKIGEVSKLLKISRSGVYRLIESGDLQRVSVLPHSPRITGASVAAFIARMTAPVERLQGECVMTNSPMGGRK